MTIIKIDRSTIKKNNNCGVHYQVTGPVEYRRTVVVTTKYISNNNKDWLLESENTDVTATSSQPTVPLYILGGNSPYYYNYEPTEVKCEYCEKEFLHTELKSDWIGYDSDGGYYEEYERVKICPHCDMSECCELEYEKFSKDILEEIPL